MESQLSQLKAQVQRIQSRGRTKLSPAEKQELDLFQAQVFELENKKIQAAALYYSLSGSRECLEKALVNCLKASLSERRSGLLQLIKKDPRAQSLTDYNLLNKSLTYQIMSNDEINEFERKYGQSNDTFLEHNIVAFSKYYKNISIDSLTKKTQKTENEIYELLENMICEGRLRAVIDQQVRIVEFKEEDNNNTIEQFCTKLYNCAQKLK